MQYFLHGIIFSVLMIFITVVWAILLIPLVLCGFIIGLLIGFVFFFFMIGYLNVFVTMAVWNAQANADPLQALIHGFVLFVVLLSASVPSLIIQTVVPSIPTYIVLFVTYCFVDGFLARKVADGWVEKGDLPANHPFD